MSERRIGILIASSRFPEESKLEDLRFPENDVDGLNEILTSKDHGQFTQTFLLKNRLHHEILLKINQVLREADKNDLVLIYYSGHGKLNPAGKLHLTSTDSVINALEATSIPVSTIRDYVDISSSNKIVLILDCCFSGAAGEAFARGGVDDQLHLVSGGRGTYILTASTGIQVAQEKESDQYGVFTKHLIEGIKSGEADLDSDGRITMGDLYRYVHDKVLDEGFQEPMKWDLNVRGEMVIARSGKTPREERRKQIREMLGELWTKGILPEDILDKARKVSVLNPEQISGELRAYDDLLGQLIQKKVEVGEFISKWYKISSKQPTSIPEKPALKPTEQISDRPEPVKARPIEPKPVSAATTESEPSEPHKISRALKFGMLIAAAILISIVGFSLYSQHQVKEASQEQVKEALQEMEQLKTRVLNLENAIEKLDKPEQIEELYRQRDTLSQQVEGFSEQAVKVKAGLGLEMEDLQERLKQIQFQLANKEKELFAARIFVESVPEHAMVRILNIDQGFRQGMELEPGKYHVQVSSEGYETQRRLVELGPGAEKRITFKLAKITPKVGWLYVETVPDNATVKILNIAQRFRQGMELEPGKYHVQVSSEGYETQRGSVELGLGEKRRISFELEKIIPKIARLRVETFPEDATVRILNIKPRFSQGMELEPGSYHVEVSSEGYETQRRLVELGPGAEKRITFELAKITPKVGWLYVETVPDNATVKILNIAQRFRQGMELEPGKYHVQVSSEGYETQRRLVELGPGKKRRITFELSKITPKVGWLYVGTVPKDAKIIIRNISQRFRQGMELEAGKYHIEVSSKGYEPQRRGIELGPGEKKRITFKLIKKRNATITGPSDLKIVH
jgi:cell division protein FtsB